MEPSEIGWGAAPHDAYTTLTFASLCGHTPPAGEFKNVSAVYFVQATFRPAPPLGLLCVDRKSRGLFGLRKRSAWRLSGPRLAGCSSSCLLSPPSSSTFACRPRVTTARASRSQTTSGALSAASRATPWCARTLAASASLPSHAPSRAPRHRTRLAAARVKSPPRPPARAARPRSGPLGIALVLRLAPIAARHSSCCPGVRHSPEPTVWQVIPPIPTAQKRATTRRTRTSWQQGAHLKPTHQHPTRPWCAHPRIGRLGKEQPVSRTRSLNDDGPGIGSVAHHSRARATGLPESSQAEGSEPQPACHTFC